MTEATKPNYKQTLNLPKTDFAMRGNLAQTEPQTLHRWQKARMYEQALAARSGGAPFIFHDGPPYANGSIHIGHLLNMVLKDMVVRSRLMSGRRCAFVPGWDCHGLPIEHKVMTELMESGKAAKLDTLTEDQRRMAIRRECAKYAEKYVKLQSTQRQRLLTLGDFDHPYLTMAPEYERGVLMVFADLIERGLVKRALKPVHWSIANQTALAEAELEYEDREDLSVYVDFEAADREAVGRAFGVELDSTPSFMIWTTTPWTLPANLALAVGPRIRYALVEADGSLTIMARELVEKVTKAAGSEKVKVLAECDGAALVGLRYRHPFCDDALLGEARRVVAADYVSVEDGTGIVHTAPGHGEDDFRTGQRESLPVYCPVRADGTYDDSVPEWLRGLSVWEANPRVTERLRASGHLFFDHKFTHSYPHDWRSRTPVIFRATEQWFVGVDQAVGGTGGATVGDRREPTVPVDATTGEGTADSVAAAASPAVAPGNAGRSLRQRALHAIEHEINFIPDWGRNRMRGMLESRPDWCVSRQRAWGLPIPAFTRPDGTVFMTAASVRAVAECFAKKGSDAWFTEPPNVLLATYDPAAAVHAPPDLASLRKSYDILDVWFESGSSWNAVLRQRDLGFPADLYLEGSDQHRGWFQSSLLPSLGVTGQSPFKSVLTHGFMVDKDGRKMSKSLGNALNVDDLLKNHGADVCRWWVSSLAYENDIKVDPEYFNLAGESYRKVRNTLRFLLSNLYDFKCTTGDQCGYCVDFGRIAPTSIDGYALQEAGSVQREVMAAYEAYEFRRANQLLYDFCNETLSAFYCAAVKDRLYCDRADSPRRRATQTVMWDVADMLCKLLAPIMPHTADEAYRSLWRDESRSVHLEAASPLEFRADADWSQVMAARQGWLKAIEDARQGMGIDNPLDCGLRVQREAWLEKFDATDLADLCGISRFELVQGAAQPQVVDLRAEARCERSWKRDGTVRQRPDGGMLCDRCAAAVGVESVPQRF